MCVCVCVCVCERFNYLVHCFVINVPVLNYCNVSMFYNSYFMRRFTSTFFYISVIY